MKWDDDEMKHKTLKHKMLTQNYLSHVNKVSSTFFQDFFFSDK